VQQRNHRDLSVRQAAMRLTQDIYALTSTFPKDELFGLSSQMRRAAVSVPSNIAEGSARNGTKELIHFLGIATGSLSELDTQLELVKRLGYSKDINHIQATLDETTALILAMAKSLRSKLDKQ
jgi:four helix bundle protein